MSMNDHAASEGMAKRQILVGLSAALSVLSARMQSQQDAAVKITVLAVRAEQIAERAWDLTNATRQQFQRDSEVLVDDIKAFAAEVAKAAKRAGEEALLGREVARAITAHAEDIGRLAQDIDTLPDASAVRARLRPLSQTLSSLPERLKANAATIRDVKEIAALAGGLAERSDGLAAGGLNAHRAAVTLCQDLRHFAEEATTVSLEMTRGSALAVKAINDMAEKTVELSLGKTVSDQPPEVPLGTTALARDARPADEVWVSTTSKHVPHQIPGSTVWGTAPHRR